MKKTLLSALILSLSLGVGATVSALEPAAEPLMLQDKNAKKKPPKSKKVEAMLPETGKAIGKVVELYELKDFQGALAELDKLKKRHERGKLKGIGSATMWQFYGTLYYELEQPEKTIMAYEEFLKFKDSVNEGLYLQVLNNMATLKFGFAMDLPEGSAQDRALDEVKSLFKRWESLAGETISANQYFTISQVYLFSEDYRNTLAYVDKTISTAQAANIELKENWYRARLQSQYSLEDYPAVIDTLLTLIDGWPNPKYWKQLAGAFSQNDQEKEFFAVTEINYESGFLERSADYTNMAQIFMANEVPIKAAWALEAGLKDKIVDADEKTYSLLGMAYLRASEFDKAIGPVSKAAEMEKDWKKWQQVGQLEQAAANFKNAEKAYQEALELLPTNNKKDRFTLLNLIGVTQTEQKNFKAAKKSFNDARKFASTSRERRQMTGYDKYLKNEETRFEMLK